MLCISAPMFAQYGDYYLQNVGYNLGKKPSLNVKIATSYDSTFKKNGKLKSVEINTYHKSGKLIYSNSNNGKKETFYTLHKDSLYKGGTTFRKGDTSSLWEYEFNEFDLPVSYFWAQKSIHKISWRQVTLYDEKNRPIKYENRNAKNKVLGYSTISYSEDGKIAERRYYYKGKLESVYSYACDGKGEPVKKADNIQYCSSKGAHADGRYYVTNETIKNGKSQREILTYSSDSLLISYEKTNIKGKLLWKREYSYQNKLLKTMFVYNRKGKLINRNEYEYLNEGYRSSLKKYKGNGTLITHVKTNYDWRN